MGKSQMTSSSASPVASNIDRELSDPGITGTFSIGRRRGIRDDLTFVLHDHNGMDAIKPGGDHGLCPQIGLKSADAIFNALIINPRNGSSVSACRYSHPHVASPSSACAVVLAVRVRSAC